MQSELSGSCHLLQCFLLRAQGCFLLKVGNGRALMCKTFVLQTNRSGNENHLEINGLSCPNLYPKDLILI